MVNRYQESYLFALSSISSIRSFTWTREDRDTRELTAQVSSYISTLVRGLMQICMDSVFLTAKMIEMIVTGRGDATLHSNSTSSSGTTVNHFLVMSDCLMTQ